MTRARRIAIGGGVAAIALACALFLLREPAFAADAADGSYHHDCCGTVLLKTGEMVLGDRKRVGYALGQDEQGPFLLPETFVGTWEDRGFEIDGTRQPVKLRLDRLQRPQFIILPAAHGSYRFTRKPPLKRSKPFPS